MAYFLVKFENRHYANTNLYIDAVAKSERELQKLQACKIVSGRQVLDQVLYPVTPEQEEACAKYNPVYQDFDASVRLFNAVSGDALKQIASVFRAAVITIDGLVVPDRFKYKYLTFFRVKDWDAQKKYRAVQKMAAIKLCGGLYIALNAVDVRVDAPIIAVLKN